MKSSRPRAARTLLRAAGVRLTGPRVAVLEILRQVRAPLSHGDMVVALEGSGYDRATLFRNLNA